MKIRKIHYSPKEVKNLKVTWFFWGYSTGISFVALVWLLDGLV
jgi:hypothetical protein